jgi:hypothetical protein
MISTQNVPLCFTHCYCTAAEVTRVDEHDSDGVDKNVTKVRIPYQTIVATTHHLLHIDW